MKKKKFKKKVKRTEALNIKDVFTKLRLSDWEFHRVLKAGKTGQAQVIGVRRKSDGFIGVFRLLKSNEERDIKFFRREVEVLSTAEFKNPFIVNIQAHSLSTDSLNWYISEKGEEFPEYWRKYYREHSKGEIVQKAFSVLADLCKGLVKLHLKGIVHRDIKPKNIIIKNGYPVLIDFGMVHLPFVERISPKERGIANLAYSPDQAMYWSDNIPPWFDVFNLGQLLIWMLHDSNTNTRSRSPLHWRWVKYPTDISENVLTVIRAITASCSDDANGPQNAEQLLALINNLSEVLKIDDKSKTKEESKLDAITGAIALGHAKASIQMTQTKSAYLIAREIFYLKMKLLLERIRRIEILNKETSAYKIGFAEYLGGEIGRLDSQKKFDSDVRLTLFEIRCATAEDKWFWIKFNTTFYPEGVVGSFREKPLPENSLPFDIDINISSINSHFNAKLGENRVIHLDRSGTYWLKKGYSLERHSEEEIFNFIQNLVEGAESWELINL